MSRTAFYCRCGARLEGASARLEHRCTEPVRTTATATRFVDSLFQGINALESIGAQYKLVEDAPGELSGPYFRDAAALRDVMRLVERAERLVSDNLDTGWHSHQVVRALAAGYKAAQAMEEGE